jgi:O-antigen ligase
LVFIFLLIITFNYWSIDPFVSPKLVIVSAAAFACTAVIIRHIDAQEIIRQKVVVLVAISFITVSIITTLVTGGNFATKLFGIFGRNTGMLAYISIFIIWISFILCSSQLFISKVFKVIILASSITLIIAFLQTLNTGPKSLLSDSKQILSNFGNINFFSAFLAMLCILCLSLLLYKDATNKNKVFTLLVLLSSLYILVFKLQSQQGVYLLLGGLVFYLILYFYIIKKKILFSSCLLLLLGGGTFGVLGIFNKGPLAKLIYEPSIIDRGYCWESGLKTFISNPFTGVGYDQYLMWWHRSNSIEAIQFKGINGFCDSSHNVIIDIAVNGGIFLLLIYIAANIFIALRVFRILQKISSFNPLIIGLVVVWSIYLIQSLISMNYLVLAGLGWAMGGLIIGYSKNYDNDLSPIKVNPLKWNNYIYLIIFTLCGAVLGAQPQITLNTTQNAYAAGNADQVLISTKKWPRDAFLGKLAVQRMQENSLYDYELILAKNLVTNFPDYFTSWKALYDAKNATVQDRDIAKQKMESLYPLYFASLDTYGGVVNK